MAKMSSSAESHKATVTAVPVFDNPLSKGISFGRVAALLGLLVWRFDALVADPVLTLRAALPVVAVLQCVYVVLCIPSDGAQQAKTAKKGRPGEKKKAEVATPNSIVTAILALVLSAIATPVIHLVFVLFGAPLLDHVANTLLCAAHFALLGLFPVLYARGLDSQALVAVAGASAPLDETFGGLLGAALGAWLGALPIPLDWDREWQRWPVTVICGLCVGSCLGSWVSGAVFYGKRLGGSGNIAKGEQRT